jgi:ketosteroid isomerase-like protein
MGMTNQEVAEAFSSHRFSEVFAQMAEDVEWVSVGGSVVKGRDAVMRACENSAAEVGQLTTEFTRFISVAGSDAAAVDAIGRYVEESGETSVVSSCDIYEFVNDELSRITSYAVELPSE